MTDENKTATGDQGPQPGVDADMIRQAVQGAVGDALANWTPPEPRSVPNPRPTADNNQRNPLVDLVVPIVEPAFRALDLATNDARDVALFYTEHPEALEFKGDVEKAAESLKKQGTPMTREAVWDWFRGKNFGKFHERENKRQVKEAEDAARAAAMVGPGSPAQRSQSTKDPHDMTDEELAEAVKGVAF